MGHEASNGAKSPYAIDGHGRIVLVLQGGGALGAYQAGVYQALHEAGIEPDWMIGTSIGAINAALIAGNEPREPRASAARVLAAHGAQVDLARVVGVAPLRAVGVLPDDDHRRSARLLRS